MGLGKRKKQRERDAQPRREAATAEASSPTHEGPEGEGNVAAAEPTVGAGDEAAHQPAPSASSAAPDSGTPGAPTLQKGGQTSTIWLPHYLDPSINAWLRENPRNNVRTLILSGLQALGLPVRPEDLVAQRARRWGHAVEQPDAEEEERRSSR